MLLLCAGILTGQQVSVTLSRNEATVGDPLILKFIVKHGQRIQRLEIIPGKGAFEILKESSLSSRKLEDQWVMEKDRTIGFFKTGEFVVGPFTLELYAPDGQLIATVDTRSIPVHIGSTLAGEEDILALKDPLYIQGNPLYILKYVFLLLLLAAVVVVILIFTKRIRDRRRQPSLPLPVPLEEFRRQISALREEGLFERGQKKLFSLRLYSIIKRFLERTYDINAPDLTTRETMDFLSRIGHLEKLKQDFQYLFDNCDLVKFARFDPRLDVYREVLRRIDSVIAFYQEQAAQEEKEEGTAE